MGQEVVDVIIGKHTKYQVIRDRTWWSTTYQVKSTDGKYHGRFDRRDKAVEWATEKAKTR